MKAHEEIMKLREQFKRKQRKYSLIQWVNFWIFLPLEILPTVSKKDYRNSQAIEPYAHSKGTGRNVLSKVSNPVILNTGGATKTRD